YFLFMYIASLLFIVFLIFFCCTDSQSKQISTLSLHDALPIYNPNDLPKLLEVCKNHADVAIGSRYVKGVNVVNWPLSRVLLSYFASVYVRFITGMNIMDTTAGFICYHRSVLENINLEKIKFVGYAFQIEMKYRAFSKDFKLVEVPIIFTDRTKGKSKMSGGIIKEAVFGVLQLRLKKLLKKL